MGLSRIGSMTFAGVTVTNLDFNLNTPKLVSVDRACSPTMQYEEFTAPYRNGSKYYDNRYDDIEIKVVIGFNGTATERQAKITNLLQQWIGKEDKLIFADRPNLFYKARFYKSVTNKDSGTFTQITITFIASFCLYELYDDLRDYLVANLTMTADSIGALVNRAIWENITSYTVKTISNKGNFEAQPLFIIDGTATLLTLEVNNAEFSIANLNGTVFVDTENMNVYKVVSNQKVSVLPQWQGVFPTIPSGESTVYIGGTDLNVSITIDFKNTYIV
ncbi:phage tail family protein [Cellulosilyticum sp. ST5]|uniref:distal tail protein Dit n=1 Tax=Cellulosilyticum sp. ST5 TaxID=3055805 RepID=UPI0039776189